jgi:hypothetical protein
VDEEHDRSGPPLGLRGPVEVENRPGYLYLGASRSSTRPACPWTNSRRSP